MARGMQLQGARVLITGGGSGLGRRMALEAAGRGSEVVLWDLNLEGAEAVRDAIVAAGGRASAQRVDVSDRDVVGAAAQEAGPIDVLVNNAGVVSGTRLMETPADRIRLTFDVNVLALYWTTQAFLGGMIERRRGTVVTIASAAGLIGVARQTDYSASKWAAIGFTESLRAELRADRHPIGTLAVAPYYIDTGMFEGVTTRFPALLPILKEPDVARRVLDAVERGRPLLALPPLVRAVPALRALPVGVFDRVADLLGINRGMDGFVGRARSAQRPEASGSER